MGTVDHKPPTSMNVLIRILLLAAVLSGSAGVAEGVVRRSVKKYDSPDKMVQAIVTTFNDRDLGPESNIEFRTVKGDLIGLKKFISKDRAHGYGILQARWSPDARYFIFSTVASGGREGGKFPTYVYGRASRKIYQLDHALGTWVTDPGFSLLAENVLLVSVHGRNSAGAPADTLTKRILLDELIR